MQQELFKLKLGPNALRDDYSRHLTTVFNLWTKIDGNSVEKLDKFYNVLFATFDEVPTGTRYYTVHEYLTKKIHRQDPIIIDPLRFFADVAPCESCVLRPH